MKKSTIPITAPTTTRDAHNRFADLIDALGAIRTAALSQRHELTLPYLAGVKLTEAREALMEAHRETERAILKPETVKPFVELPQAEHAPLDLAHAKEFSERAEKRLEADALRAQEYVTRPGGSVPVAGRAIDFVDKQARLEGYQQAMRDIFEALGAK